MTSLTRGSKARSLAKGKWREPSAGGSAPLRRLAQPVGAGVGWQRRAADEGLDGGAALAAQHLELGLALDALGDEPQAELLGEADHGTGEEGPVLVLRRAVQEGSGELDRGERGIAQRGQRAHAGAEAVERQPHAELAQRRERLAAGRQLLEQQPFV